MSWRTSATLNCSVFPKPCCGDSPSNATFLPHNSRTIRPASVISGAWFAAWLAPGARAAPMQTQEKATKATTAGILTRTITDTISGTDSSRVRWEPRLPGKTASRSRDFVRIVGYSEVGLNGVPECIHAVRVNFIVRDRRYFNAYAEVCARPPEPALRSKVQALAIPEKPAGGRLRTRASAPHRPAAAVK